MLSSTDCKLRAAVCSRKGGSLSPTNAVPVSVTGTTDNLLFPRGPTPARDNAEAKPQEAGWIGLLSRLLPRSRLLMPAEAPSQSAEQFGWEALQFDGPWATLRVEPGTGEARYWLTLRLSPRRRAVSQPTSSRCVNPSPMALFG